MSKFTDKIKQTKEEATERVQEIAVPAQKLAFTVVTGGLLAGVALGALYAAGIIFKRKD